MTKDDVIRWAREAGFEQTIRTGERRVIILPNALFVRFAALVAANAIAAEREACAQVVGAGYVRPQDAEEFARAIEAEVRKADDALILQLVEALERSSPHTDHEYRFKPKDWMKRRAEAIQAGRARLGEKEASTALSDAGIKVS